MDAAVRREGPYDQFVLGSLTAKHFFTSLLWCLILGISPLVFSSDWYFLAITGSINLLPYFIVGSLMIWPWTSVVISGVMFTIQKGTSISKITESTHFKHEGEERGDDHCADELYDDLNLTLEGIHRAECAMKQSLHKIDHGSWIFSFVSALLMCHLTIIFMSIFLSWLDILVTGFQYRALLFIFAIVVLSLLLIVIFIGLAAEWLKAWTSSSDQQFRPSDHTLTVWKEDTVSNPLEELVPTESLYAEVFVQTEDVDKSLSNQNMKDEGDHLSCDGMDQIELEELLTELNKVTDWFRFGINLEIPEARLKEIEQKYKSVESCKREMLTVWMQLIHPTWIRKAIVIALAGIDMKDLALKIATKYGISFPLSLTYIIHQLEYACPDSEQPMYGDADSSSISSQEVQFQMKVCIIPPNEPVVLETATNDTEQVSTPPSNELGLFETVTNDTDQHEVSNDNTQLLQDLPMEVSVPPPHEASVSTSDTEQVSEHEISDENTQKLQDLSTEVSIPPPNEANVSISDTEQVSDDNTHEQLQDLPSPTSYDEVHDMHLGSLKWERVCDECYRKYKSGEIFNSVHEKEEDEYVLIT